MEPVNLMRAVEDKCLHLRDDGTCDIASSLARQPVTPHVSACTFCSQKAEPPQELNRVTVSLAVGAVRGTPLQQELLTLYGFWLPKAAPRASDEARLNAILSGTGVGSQLWRLLKSIGITHSASCACLGWAERMNAWGVAGCRANRAEIIEHMRNSAKDYGWGDLTKAAAKTVWTGLAWHLSLTDPYGSLLDEAICKAQKTEN